MNVERCATHENIECPICEDKAEIERLRAELAEYKQKVKDVPDQLRRAFNLGQTYWQQADSESYSQNKKADVTRAAFNALVDAALKENNDG